MASWSESLAPHNAHHHQEITCQTKDWGDNDATGRENIGTERFRRATGAAHEDKPHDDEQGGRHINQYFFHFFQIEETFWCFFSRWSL